MNQDVGLCLYSEAKKYWSILQQTPWLQPQLDIEFWGLWIWYFYMCKFWILVCVRLWFPAIFCILKGHWPYVKPWSNPCCQHDYTRIHQPLKAWFEINGSLCIYMYMKKHVLVGIQKSNFIGAKLWFLLEWLSNNNCPLLTYTRELHLFIKSLLNLFSSIYQIDLKITCSDHFTSA